jgi:hypothetical protein
MLSRSCPEDFRLSWNSRPKNEKNPSEWSEELLICCVFLSLDLTYLSRLRQDGIGTLLLAKKANKQVVKASQGHYPQPFLISK